MRYLYRYLYSFGKLLHGVPEFIQTVDYLDKVILREIRAEQEHRPVEALQDRLVRPAFAQRPVHKGRKAPERVEGHESVSYGKIHAT